MDPGVLLMVLLFCSGHRRHCLPLLLLPLCLRLAQGSLLDPKNFPQPPVLLEMPESFTAFSQDDVHLPCEASGNPTPSFRWVKDGELMDLDMIGEGTIKADKNDSLDQYHGSYRCLASNTLGTAVSQTVHVIVERHPVHLTQKKLNKSAYEGESLVLSCSPPESSIPPHIHWMDRKMVHVETSERVTPGLNGNLYFANLLKSDSRADYICNAQYSAAMTVLPDTAVSVHVMPSNSVIHGRKPRLFTPSGLRSSMLALKGNSLTLECIPGGLPTPMVEWTKKDGKLEETTWKEFNHGRWLHFESVEQSDDGAYQCRAQNEHGEISHFFTVTVEAAPYWVKEPQNLMYAPRESVRLDCQAEGIPTPTVTWSMNGQPLSEVDADPRRSVSGGVLKLLDVEVVDTAVYQCEAKNKHGSILLNTYNVVEFFPVVRASVFSEGTSVSSEGASRVQRVLLMLGTNFSASCSLDEPFLPGQFHLLSPTGNYTLPSVNHSAHFLIQDFSPAHIGNYTCVYCETVYVRKCLKSSTLYVTPGGESPTTLVLVSVCVVVIIIIIIISATVLTIYCKRHSRKDRGTGSGGGRGGPNTEREYENICLESPSERIYQDLRQEDMEQIYSVLHQH